MSKPISSNHNDLQNIKVQFEIVTATLEKAGIPVEGLFLNSEADFDFKNFREICRKIHQCLNGQLSFTVKPHFNTPIDRVGLALTIRHSL